MRYTAGHREQTRAKILRAAGKVFRRQGYHAAGVDKVMEEAGLTAGGFYAHFDSKEALLAELLDQAAKGEPQRREHGGFDRSSVGRDFRGALPESEAPGQDRGGVSAADFGIRGCAGRRSVKAGFEAIVRGLATRLQATRMAQRSQRIVPWRSSPSASVG